MKITKKYLFLYFFWTSILSSLIFCIGFFPLSFSSKDIASIADLPKKLDDQILLDPVTDYKSSVDKIVFMIIDALRLDFIDQKENFKFLNKLLRSQDACLVKLYVKSPTVTMPRIKALTSGTIPSFLDVVLNLGSTTMQIDNILNQLKPKNQIVFAGDSTWMSMFPNTFLRHYENQDSLFVNDFHEGDKNVTNCLTDELKRDDWKLLILHYLGLDHIGHVEGPFSDKIPGKLQEMDHVIKMIYHKIEEMNRNAKKRSILLLTGDHGMRDSGGHGGSSHAETIVPLILIGTNCRSNKKNLYQQIDFATTFSVLNGIPVPHSSVGTVIPELLDLLHPRTKLYSYYYTNKRLLDKLKQDIPENEIYGQEYYVQYKEAKNLHKIFLNSSKENVEKLAEVKYFMSSQKISQILMKKFFKLDLFLMVVAIVSSVLTSLAILSSMLVEPNDLKIPLKDLVFVVAIGFFLYYFIFTELFDQSRDLKMLVIFLLVLCFMYVNSSLVYRNWLRIRTKEIKDLLKIRSSVVYFLIFGQIWFTLSSTSSSFIEEEHQTWYYLTSTLFLLLIYENAKCAGNQPNWEIIFNVPILLTHSIIRRLNQTGDKWLATPDIGDWLAMEEHVYWLNISFLIGLLLCLVLLMQFTRQWQTRILILLAMTMIFLYRVGSVAGSKSVIEVFWIIIFIMLIVNNFPVILSLIAFASRQRTRRSGMRASTNKLLLFRTTFIVLFTICTLLHKRHNVMLNAICGFTCIFINRLCDNASLKGNERLVSKIVGHYWIGKMFFFYQGNSNNLASIDLNAGYVGLTQFNFATVGLFLTLNVFNGQIIAFLMLIHHLLIDQENCQQQKKKHNEDLIMSANSENRIQPMIQMIRCITALITLPTMWFLIVITILREHLFIWTVFSPKLLYEIYHTVLVFLLMNLVYLLSK